MLSKNKYLRKLFFAVNGLLAENHPVLCSKTAYAFARKRTLCLDPPGDLNEKFMWLKLHIYNENSMVSACADKYTMRQYVEEKGFPELLNPLYGVWDSVEEIEYESLPERFVFKCNHGSGYNLICRKKEEWDWPRARKTLDKWMKEEYWKRSAELQYKHIQKKILCERYLEGTNGSLPDYKVMCFYGEPQYILYCDGREGKLRYINFSLDWQILPYNFEEPEDIIERPKHLEQMLECAKVLSKEFPAVRMDFYESTEGLIIGEMTFTPAGCVGIALPREGLDYYGKKLELNKLIEKYNKKRGRV